MAHSSSKRCQSWFERARREAYGLLQPIPKVDGIDVQFDVTVAAMEDKIVQAAVVAILTPIYESEFLGFSYRFRPKRNQHQALDALAFGIGKPQINWVLDCRRSIDKVSRAVRYHLTRSGFPPAGLH
jgi:hypothetical protein